MNLFVIACCFCFLGVVLFLDIWKHFMGVSRHPEYLQGLFVVPILMLSKIFLGIYYNLSIWYKLTNKTSTGAVITIIGAVITLLINYFFIPMIGFWACALATLACYGSMMVISYIVGQVHYPVPYQWKHHLGYIGFAAVLFLIHTASRKVLAQEWQLHAEGILLIGIFFLVIMKREKQELVQIP